MDARVCQKAMCYECTPDLAMVIYDIAIPICYVFEELLDNHSVYFVLGVSVFMLVYGIRR